MKNPTYEWKCHSCQTTNNAGTGTCSQCGLGAYATGTDIENAKINPGSIGKWNTSHRSLGVALTVYLAFSTLVSIAAIMIYLDAWKRMIASTSPAIAYLIFSFAVLRLVAIVLIWCWSRSGVVLFVSLLIADIALAMHFGARPAWQAVPFRILMLILVYKKWPQMQWGIVSPMKSAPNTSLHTDPQAGQ